jgi:hypothetical protein
LMITRKHIQKWKGYIHYLIVVLHPKYDLAFIQMKGCTWRVKPDWGHRLYRMWPETFDFFFRNEMVYVLSNMASNYTRNQGCGVMNWTQGVAGFRERTNKEPAIFWAVIWCYLNFFENRGDTRIGYLIICFHGYLSEPGIWMNVCDNGDYRLW